MKKHALTLVTAMGAIALVGCSTAKPQPEPPAKLVVQEVKENCYNALQTPTQASGRAMLESGTLFYYSATCDQDYHSIEQKVAEEPAEAEYPEYKTHSDEADDAANTEMDTDSEGAVDAEVDTGADVDADDDEFEGVDAQEEPVKAVSATEEATASEEVEYDSAATTMQDDAQQKPGQLVLEENDAMSGNPVDLDAGISEVGKESSIEAAPLKEHVELPPCDDVTDQNDMECIDLGIEIKS